MMTTLVCLPMEESPDLSGDDQLVLYKHELHFSMVDHRMFYTSGRWLIAINCFSHHCSALAMAQAASDASVAASTAPSTNSVGSSHRRRRRQDDSPPDYDESVLRPLVQSIQDLAECQRQLVIDRSEDRRHERDLQQQKQESTKRGNCQERIFRRKAELSDLVRKYRRLNAELDLNDERSPRLSEFYINEGRHLEHEIRQLDLQIRQQRPNDEHSRELEMTATSD